MLDYLILASVAACIVAAFVLAYVQNRPHVHTNGPFARMCHLNH